MLPEFVHLNAVPSAFLEGKFDSIFGVAWAQEHPEDSFCVVISVHVEVVSKRLVVQSINSGLNVNFVNQLARIYRHFQVENVGFEVGFKFTLNSDASDMDALEAEFFVGVRRKRILVLFEYAIHVLVETEESGVSGGRFKVLHDTGRETVLAVRVGLTAKEDVSVVVESAVVLNIGGVHGRLDDVTKMIDSLSIHDIDVRAISGGDVSMVNSVTDSGLVDDHVSHSDDTVNIFEPNIIGPGWEFTTVPVSGVGSKALNDKFVPVEFFYHVEVVGKTFGIETGSKLVMGPEEKFSLAVQMVAVLVLPPEGVVHVPGDVMDVHSDIFSEVGNVLFCVPLASSEVHVEGARNLGHLRFVGFLDDLGIGEHVGGDLVERRENDSFAEVGVVKGGVQGIYELALIHPFPEESGIVT